MPSLYSEDILIEQPAIVLPNKLGGEPLNCYEETFGSGSTLGRETSSEVVLVSRPVPALEKLNPPLPLEAFTPTIGELLHDRSRVSLAEANRQLYENYYGEGKSVYARLSEQAL